MSSIIDLVLHKQSLGATVIPRGNKLQWLWKNLGGGVQTRRVMGDVQMADAE